MIWQRSDNQGSLRVWRLLALAALVISAFALSGDTSRAEPDVDVVVTETEITLSWDARGTVVFYWHLAAGGATEIATVSGKSHTISGLQPDTQYRIYFYQGVFGELFVTTLASAPDAPAPTNDHSPLVAQVTGWRNDSRYVHNQAHTDRWDRVLLTLGEPVSDSSLTRMSAAEAQTYADRGWQRWVGVTQALTEIELTNPMPTGTPELSISAGPDVLEGETLSFTVTATPPPTSPLTVDVGIDTTGDFTVWDGTRTVTIPLSGTFTTRISSYDDGIDEPDGSVTATISAGSDYTISSSSGTATVTIQDDDDPPLPLVGISSAPTSVTEGESIELTITSTPAPTSDLDVTLTVFTIGDFGIATGLQTATIPTSGSASVTLATTDDDVDEEDGFVSITIGAGSGYDIASATGVRVVTVQDGDLKLAPLQTQSEQDEDQQSTAASCPEYENDDPPEYTANSTSSVEIQLIGAADFVLPEGSDEHPGCNRYWVRLTADPGGSVTVDLTVTNGAKIASVSPSQLTFDSTNFGTPQLVKVTANESAIIGRSTGSDGVVRRSQGLPFTISHTLKDTDGNAIGSPTSFSGETWKRFWVRMEVKFKDSDLPYAPMSLSKDGIYGELKEEGETFTVLIRGNAARDSGPRLPITIRPWMGDCVRYVDGTGEPGPSEYTVSPEKLTITSDNWLEPQEVTVTLGKVCTGKIGVLTHVAFSADQIPHGSVDAYARILWIKER